MFYILLFAVIFAFVGFTGLEIKSRVMMWVGAAGLVICNIILIGIFISNQATPIPPKTKDVNGPFAENPFHYISRREI